MQYCLFNIAKPVEFISAGKSQGDDNWMHYERVIDQNIMFMVLEGSLHIKVDGTEYSLHEGEVLFIRANAYHVGFKPAAVTYYWIHFQPKLIKYMEKATNPYDAESIIIPMVLKLAHVENVVVLVNQLIHYYRREKNNSLHNYLLTAILIDIANQSNSKLQEELSGKHRRFEEIACYIEANYLENLQVAEIAWKFGYNPKYLVRLFRTFMNTTVIEYINEVRLRVAEGLLLSTNNTVFSIAENSGFNSYRNFMKVFKKKYGISPTQYRNVYHGQFITRYK